MRLTAYLRTSRGGGNRDSLDAQRDACREWASANGHAVVSTFEDGGVSGGLPVDERPGLLGAIVEVEAGRADGLVVHRADRLARELHVQEVALARLWGVGEGVSVFEAVEGEIKRDDPDDPHRRFLRQVMGAAAELERGLIRARLRRGRRRKVERGGYVGGARLHRRYGYRLETRPDGRREYAPVPNEQATITEMAARYSRGETLGSIASWLSASGIPPVAGSSTWRSTSVRSILRRAGVQMRPPGRRPERV